MVSGIAIRTAWSTRKTFYGIYGEIRSNVELTGGAPDPAHKCTGKRLDPHVALADYGARWYDPAQTPSIRSSSTASPTCAAIR